MNAVNELLLPLYQQLQQQLKEKRAEVAQLEKALQQLGAIELSDDDPNLVARVARAPRRAVSPVVARATAHEAAGNGVGLGRYTQDPALLLDRIGKPGRNGLNAEVIRFFKRHPGRVMHVGYVSSAMFPGLRGTRKSRVHMAVGRTCAYLAAYGKLHPHEVGKKTGRYVLPR